MAYIEIDNVAKRYGATEVLERLSLTVDERAFVTIVGASGCGKSTFLRLLLGAEPPSAGEIRLGGEPLPAEPDARRGIVFQRYSVFPHLTALGNVLLAIELRESRLGRLFGASRRRAVAEGQAMLERVGLGHARDQYATALSGGMQQRLSIAQSLVRRPPLMLLDEPFGALDPGIRKDMHALILELWENEGLTIFMVTHDLEEGFHLGTRLLVFDKVRHDPQAPERYGATITYDLPVARRGEPPPELAGLDPTQQEALRHA
ncbi:ATP-binding cassette domain-containing protein [Spiribacter halobius]|uniref:Lauroyl acyltransferase n=1 Tax=Sediminicurvatus halobius TaxID=2182432 RepID=A0A2U2N9E9_9GAMM|nr:ATP-binding cassette domain-containing protein [Spiribacter halobius]PWG65718.1 lauroyl acyltransferase [Spiribacter halobius]UEX77752.1 ATP-binding cassette domain-containing protein [Spiribacter halobius]